MIKRSLSMPTSTQMIRLAHAQRVLVEGGSLDGNKQSDVVGAGGQCTGLATAGATDVEIRNMQIYNWPADPTGGSYGYGIYLGSRVSTPNTRVRVSGVNIYGCEQNNMFLVSGKDIIIENSRFANSNGHEPGSGLDIEPNDYREVAQNVIVRNCVFEGNNDGVTCNNHWGGYWHDITFDGCTFRGNRNVGISCTWANLPESRYVLHNCKFLNNGGSGLYIAGTQGADISGCRAEGNAGLGIEMSDSRDFTVARNQIHNNLLGGVGFSE